MTTVTDFYKKDCDGVEKEYCKCRPSRFPDHQELCGFSNHLLVTDINKKEKLLKQFGYSLPPDKIQEAKAYIEEFPIYILKKGTILCHTTHEEGTFIIDDKNSKIQISNDPLWWTKYYVGQKKYNGGWFTYETGYGGPPFGLYLYYYIEKDIPLLFVPNYRAYLHKYKNSYLPEGSAFYKYEYTKLYSGSHLVKGPRNWREKGFPEIKEKYYADEFTARLVSLGFPGYISCDECEIFLTHKTMKKAMYDRPSRARVSAGYLNQRVLDNICTIFEKDKKKCSLRITEDNDRDEEKVFNIWNLKAISGDETEPKMFVTKDKNKYWRINGILHRKNDPAIELANGRKEWYFLGERHRDADLPAVIDVVEGIKEWWKHGKRHRDGLPAIEYKNGRKEWWEKGKFIRMEGILEN